MSNTNDRPAPVGEASLSEKETPQMIAVPADVFLRLVEFVDRLAERVDQRFPKEEVREPLQRILTPLEASKKMHLHPQTVMEWCREGRIKATKLGRKWLIPK